MLQRMIEREDYGLSIKTAELAKEDNLQLAQAAAQIVTAFGQLHDKGLIGDEVSPLEVSPLEVRFVEEDSIEVGFRDPHDHLNGVRYPYAGSRTCPLHRL